MRFAAASVVVGLMSIGIAQAQTVSFIAPAPGATIIANEVFPITLELTPGGVDPSQVQLYLNIVPEEDLASADPGTTLLGFPLYSGPFNPTESNGVTSQTFQITAPSGFFNGPSYIIATHLYNEITQLTLDLKNVSVNFVGTG